MVLIKNGFDFKDPCKTGVIYKVWTKEPEDLEGKCFATDITIVRSFGLYYIADVSKGEYQLKKDLPQGEVYSDRAQSIREMIGFSQPISLNLKELPLGFALNPKSYTIAMALYDLTANLTGIARSTEEPITDIVLRDIRFSADQLTKEEINMLKKAGHYQSDHVILQLTTDIYRR